MTQAHTRSCECPGRCKLVSIIIIIIGSSSIIIIIFKHIQRKAIVIFTSTFCVKLLEYGQNNMFDQYMKIHITSGKECPQYDFVKQGHGGGHGSMRKKHIFPNFEEKKMENRYSKFVKM